MALQLPPSSNPKSHLDDDYSTLAGEYQFRITESGNIVNSEWVGYEDRVDYREFILEDPGSFFFNVSNLSQKLTLTVYERKDPENPSSSLKKLTSITTSKSKETKSLLLDSGHYYLKIEYKGTRYGGTDYNIGVIADLFTKGNNEDDDFKTGTLPDAYSVEVNGSGSLISGEWVGYGDSIDCRRLILNSPGAYRFFLSDITNKVRLTVYSISYDGKGNEKRKKLTSITASANQKKGTKELLLAEGEYYVTVEATDWKKGRNTDYSVNVDGTSYFKADNTNDNWNDPGVRTFSIGGAQETFLSGEWVGFGDSIDWISIRITTPGYYNFNIQDLQNKIKLSVCSFSDTGRKKTLGSISFTPSKGSSTTLKKPLLLDRGTYYIAVEAPGWKSGKNTDYSLGSTAGELFTKADDNTNNSRASAVEIRLADGGVRDDWVGFGDSEDHFYFLVPEERDEKYSFTFNAEKGMATLKISLYNGKSYKTLDTLKGGETAVLDFDRLRVQTGNRIYLEIASADGGKGKKNTGYDVLISPESAVRAPLAAEASVLAAQNKFSGSSRDLLLLA